MFNTIILKKGSTILTNAEYKGFQAGDTIWGNDYNPVEIRRWGMDDAEAAKAELAKYRCKYDDDGQLHRIEEYAIEYCECDEDGDFVEGSDFDLAETEAKYYYWMDFNDASGKAVLYRIAYDKDGHKDPDTEEPVYSRFMEDIEGFLEAEANDIDKAYEIINADIEKHLGFLPEYEVG